MSGALRRTMRAALIAGFASTLATAAGAQRLDPRSRLALARAVSAARVPPLTVTQKATFERVVAALRRGDTAAAYRDFGSLSGAYFTRGNAATAQDLVYSAVRLGKVDPNPATAADFGRIRTLMGRLAAQGEDAQLANVDLQNALQKQQQTLQMLSTISKILSDSAMAVVRKIGG